jgi:hypothetical protein
MQAKARAESLPARGEGVGIQILIELAKARSSRRMEGFRREHTNEYVTESTLLSTKKVADFRSLISDDIITDHRSN